MDHPASRLVGAKWGGDTDPFENSVPQFERVSPRLLIEVGPLVGVRGGCGCVALRFNAGMKLLDASPHTKGECTTDSVH